MGTSASGLAQADRTRQRADGPGPRRAAAGDPPTVTDAKPARIPGPRSVATTERILGSAESLLRKHGERFTLGDVATVGRVSMASIYARYPSKAHLVREVQGRVLGSLTATIRDGLVALESEGGDLDWRVSRVVDVYSEAHLARAALIRAFHSVAREDSSLRDRGVATVTELVALATRTLGGDQSRSPQSARRLSLIVQAFLHALSNYLGFGHHAAADAENDWLAFKETMARMVALAVDEVLRQA